MRFYVVLLITLFIGTACTQNVPVAAKAKLNALYPKAEKVKWDKEDANFEANFDLNNVEMSILLDAKGNLLETETELKKDDLPDAVKATLAKDFAGYKVEETAKIVRDGKTTFEADVKKGETKLDAIFNPDGTLFKKITKKENGEDSEKPD